MSVAGIRSSVELATGAYLLVTRSEKSARSNMTGRCGHGIIRTITDYFILGGGIEIDVHSRANRESDDFGSRERGLF